LAERRKPWLEFKWRLSAESRYAEDGLIAPKSDEGGQELFS
jgi:hypothetical protein